MDWTSLEKSKISKKIWLVYIKPYIKTLDMPQTKPIVSLENVVASASVDQKIDLIEITKKFPDTEYNPEQFPGLVFRLTKPKTATLIFRTGKMVCTGAKSEEMAVKAVNTVVQMLRKSKVKIKKDAVITVQNMVASINLGGKIHLEKAARTLARSMYEPEQFPGLIHRMVDPKTVILLFASGKLVCTGAKNESDVYRSVHNLHALLEEKNLMMYDQ
jgi:transcription initiation factor TFIID TATA-box-binding protein